MKPLDFELYAAAIAAVLLALNVGHCEVVSGDDTTAVREAMAQAYEPIDSSLFEDSIHHWQRKEGRDRDDDRYESRQIVHIAENLLRYQNPDGGWPKNIDWLIVLEPGELEQLRHGKRQRSTFDNRTTYPQIAYLAQVYQRTGLERYRDAADRGLRYIVAEQRTSGGWRGSDVDAITYNDDVMAGVMTLLLAIRQGDPGFAWVDDETRTRLSTALDRAIAVTLKCQIVVAGQKTAWCQQHDHETLASVAARSYELPSITAHESTGVVQFLMQLPEPSSEVVAAVDAAVAWFEKAKITGTRLQTVRIEPIRYEHFTATTDRIVVEDPAAPPLWARYYEIDTNRPFCCNRDGVKVDRLADVEHERRVGYSWYGTWPKKVTKEYPAWKARIGE